MSGWNAQLQERWNALSRKRLEMGLSEAEQQEWEQLAQMLDAEEMETLQPALQRYDARLAELEQALETVKQEKKRLLMLLQTRQQAREELETRIQQLEQEYQTLLADRQKHTAQSVKE